MRFCMAEVVTAVNGKTIMRISKPKRVSLVLWGAIVLMGGLVVASMTLRRTESELELPPEKAVPVHVETVVPRSVDDTILLPGRIEPEVRAQLAVAKGGRVTEITVDKGDHVEEGQVLLRVDDRTWRAQLRQAEIEWREAQKAYKRWTDLAKAGTISTSEFDTVQMRLDRAEVQLEEARVYVEQCEVRSPGAGVINARHVEVGEFAPEGAAVLEWVVSDPVELVLDIAERDIGGIELGQPIPFTVSVLNGMAFTGTVAHIAEAALPENNSFRIEARVPNEDRTLRPGMIATARLQRARHEAAVVVPLAAVIPRQGEHFVFIAEGDRAVRRVIKIDRILGTEAILASGLQAGDELLVEGHRELIDGALIRRIPMVEEQDIPRDDRIEVPAHGGAGA